ncbi:MAG: hypothetical protein H2038_05395 [Brevundimonas sp.]|jgi:hypothetical protein|uniref:hypothetical protein n=1 Tax=Brevundimonas sp. TaxID=1871086 RepID=UPI0017FD9D1E|nr:hypothetical protein [Brevundimonas sp.]MBA4804068.1 hypothetical protein [Brevundimonas sp.]
MTPREEKRRLQRGLIPMLIAIRVQEARKRKAAEAAARAEGRPPPKPRKKGWF